ncbi:hypothetical protein SAMN04487969_103193 [Paenibacillus algorifonticola]|uniref:Uncharacterized protein n=1 Tax=Paenibacillus algorifonticola TaxID=684063 RepID=A0A1I2B7Q6_9BACL|nr:hypothetical protein [Paenibacillus algorifonticola]SFE52174.1 hypothetical protein SAMN04487969_103193 [Paenibacillus algorifonticola]
MDEQDDYKKQAQDLDNSQPFDLEKSEPANQTVHVFRQPRESQQSQAAAHAAAQAAREEAAQRAEAARQAEAERQAEAARRSEAARQEEVLRRRAEASRQEEIARQEEDARLLGATREQAALQERTVLEEEPGQQKHYGQYGEYGEYDDDNSEYDAATDAEPAVAAAPARNEAAGTAASGRNEAAGMAGAAGAGASAGTKSGAAGVANKLLQNVSGSVKQIDTQILLKLLKNPLEGLNLNPAKDLSYGIIGIVSAIIGFLLFGLLTGSAIRLFFGYGASDLLREGSGMSAALFGKILLLSLISIIAFLGSLWGISLWRATQRLTLSAFITSIGAMQLFAGAGFLIAGVVSLISFKLGFFVMAATLLSTLGISLVGASVASQVTKEKLWSYIVLSVCAYLLLFGLFADLIL